MLLQIHDELIFEVKEELVEEVAERFKKIMEGVYDLRVPLKCSVNIADSWDKLK
jgi:DNA polymerase-1